MLSHYKGPHKLQNFGVRNNQSLFLTVTQTAAQDNHLQELSRNLYKDYKLLLISCPTQELVRFTPTPLHQSHNYRNPHPASFDPNADPHIVLLRTPQSHSPTLTQLTAALFGSYLSIQPKQTHDPFNVSHKLYTIYYSDTRSAILAHGRLKQNCHFHTPAFRSDKLAELLHESELLNPLEDSTAIKEGEKYGALAQLKRLTSPATPQQQPTHRAITRLLESTDPSTIHTSGLTTAPPELSTNVLSALQPSLPSPPQWEYDENLPSQTLRHLKLPRSIAKELDDFLLTNEDTQFPRQKLQQLKLIQLQPDVQSPELRLDAGHNIIICSPTCTLDITFHSQHPDFHPIKRMQLPKQCLLLINGFMRYLSTITLKPEHCPNPYLLLLSPQSSPTITTPPDRPDSR